MSQFHNSSTAALQAIYDFCAMPEYIPLLRGEAERALRESGGAWTLETLNNLHRLDSFLKESQRLNSLSFRKCKIEKHFPAYRGRIDTKHIQSDSTAK